MYTYRTHTTLLPWPGIEAELHGRDLTIRLPLGHPSYSHTCVVLQDNRDWVRKKRDTSLTLFSISPHSFTFARQTSRGGRTKILSKRDLLTWEIHMCGQLLADISSRIWTIYHDMRGRHWLSLPRAVPHRCLWNLPCYPCGHFYRHFRHHHLLIHQSHLEHVLRCSV